MSDTSQSDQKLAFEDFTEGRRFELAPRTINADEIIAFAAEFDPQPMHLDEGAGKAGILGGLSASGWHTCAIAMRMFYDAYLSNSLSQGAPGVDVCKWKRPVLAGDTLHGFSEVLSARSSSSRPGIGIVQLHHEIHNQDDQLVMASENVLFVGMRAGAAS